VVGPSEVDLGEELGLAQTIQQFADERERVLVLHCDAIEGSVVDAQAEGTVLLLDEKDGSTSWRLRWTDEALGEEVIDVLAKGGELDRGERIDGPDCG
jgi:hypothetical protein